MPMAAKDTEARALLAALSAWLVHDAKFSPAYVDLLRVRFEQELKPRGMFERDGGGRGGGDSRKVSG